MGAQESANRTNQSKNGEASAAPDYYQLLEVAEDATADEIKRSFRRLALIHHPDKNHLDTEEATRKFATLQQAYEVLSDEQERAWYDSHRASLIPEADAETVFEEIKKGVKLSTRVKDRGLTVRHLSRFFDASAWSTYGDDVQSFFSIYRNLFSRLSAEEKMFDSADNFPSFGFSTWPWVPLPQGNSDCVRDFYNAWMNFSTEKDFSWMEQWNLAEAPERRVRRLMEKDNRKLRDDARREYNDTIRSLVRFIRKRDPRYKKHLESRSSQQTHVVVQTMPSSVREKAAEAYVEQEWQKVDNRSTHADLDWAFAEGEEVEEWECVACRKTFRSEAAWNSHERSKKHIREVERLRSQMEEEDQLLNLETGVQDLAIEPSAYSEHNSSDINQEFFDASKPSSPTLIPSGTTDTDDELSSILLKSASVSIPDHPIKHPLVHIANYDISDEEHSGVETITTNQFKRPVGKRKARRNVDQNNMKDDGVETQEQQHVLIKESSKREKRRAKQQVKQGEKNKSGSTLICHVCGITFLSRTKLFTHITESGHALSKKML